MLRPVNRLGILRGHAPLQCQPNTRRLRPERLAQHHGCAVSRDKSFASPDFAKAVERMIAQPETVEAAMALHGWNGGRVRRPLLDLDAAQSAARETIMQPLLRMARDMQDTAPAVRSEAPAHAA